MSCSPALAALNVASGCPDGFATYSSPAAASRMIRNSHSVVLPPATVRERPIIVPASGANQCSTIWRPLRSSSQHPAIQPTSLIVGLAAADWPSSAMTRSAPTLMRAVYPARAAAFLEKCDIAQRSAVLHSLHRVGARRLACGNGNGGKADQCKRDDAGAKRERVGWLHAEGHGAQQLSRHGHEEHAGNQSRRNQSARAGDDVAR